MYPYDIDVITNPLKLGLFKLHALKYQRNRKFFVSLRYWNMLLACRKNGIEAAYIYGQRSEIYYQMKLYKRCLRNIKMSVKNGGWTDSLKDREKLCMNQIKMFGESNPYRPAAENLILSYTANPRNPYIVNCLNVEKSTSGNRFNITTTRNLRIGDVIAIEPPIYTTRNNVTDDVEEFVIYKRCYHCQQDNFLDLIGCNECENGKSNLFIIKSIKLIN